MRRVLLTGGSGFIGSHLVSYFLAHTDWKLVLLERLGHSGNLNRLAEALENESYRERVTVVWHDLRSPVNEVVRRMLGEITDVVHLAASTHVDRSIAVPMEFVLDNVVATCNILDYARSLPGLRCFINFSTDEVFGPAPEGVYFKEDARHRPSNPYAATKAGAADLASSYFVTYGLPVITTHTMNNFGERQHPEKFIPRVIAGVTRGEKVPLYADMGPDGKPLPDRLGVRVWMYAQNTASAIRFLLDRGVPGEAYNVIGGDELDILTLAQKIAGILGKPLLPDYVGFYRARPGHDRRYALDGSKLRELGWVPEYGLEEGLRRTVEFSLKNVEWL